MKIFWASILWLMGMMNFASVAVNALSFYSTHNVLNALVAPFNVIVALYCFTGINSMYVNDSLSE